MTTTRKPTTDPQSPKIQLRCRVEDVVDGDTLTVSIKIPGRVRLLDCWAPESRGAKKSPAGVASKVNMQRLIEEHPTREGLLTIPLDGVTRIDQIFTMERLLASVQLDGHELDLAATQVSQGFATTDKPMA